MNAHGRFTRRLVPLLIVLGIAAHCTADVTIDRGTPVIEHRTFDPKHPPSDMPKLNPNEAAVTQSFFGAESRVGGQVIDQKDAGNGKATASIKIDSIQMTLKLRVTVWLPTNAVPKTVNHEEGHRKISEYYYKDAEKIAKAQADALIGKTVSGTGSTPESAGDNALKRAAEELGEKYLGQTDTPCAKAQDIYDQITAHGTNPVKEERAMKEAIARVSSTTAG
jgi:hypothetical protein